jgi:ketosteroid isomerase-like protein
VEGGLKPQVQRVYVFGDVAIMEVKTFGTGKCGNKYEMEACWICRFEGDKIVEVTAYQDSALAKRMLEENKGK